MRRLIAVLLILSTTAALAAECRRTGSVCVDATPVKTISGLSISVAQAGGCWEYQDTYECMKPYSVNYCAGIQATAGCWQTSSQCILRSFNGSCMQEQWTYRCGDPSLPTPSNTVRLDDTHTIVKDEIDTSACTANSSNLDCQLAENVCVEGAATRVINGLAVYKDCWRWEEKYSCAAKTLTSNCSQLTAKGCTYVSKRCIANFPSGTCSDYEVVYRCVASGGVQETYTDCGTKVYCITNADGTETCYDASSPADTDFARAVATMEAVRQAGAYMDGFKLFKGEEGECRYKKYGLSVKCCDTSEGAKSNHSVLNSLIMSGLGNVGEYALSVGSKFAYDFIYPDGKMIEQGMQCVNATAFSPTSFSPSVGAFGLSIAAVEPAAMIGSYSQVSTLFTTASGTQISLYFNPYAFGISIAMMVYQELISCDEDELLLGVRRGAGLCEYVDSECSGKILKTCKRYYCCYNSKLARIINEQGKAQIGKDKTDCSGFTPGEFSRLDFSAIDLTEFINDVMSSVEIPSAESLSTQASSVVNKKVQEFYSH